MTGQQEHPGTGRTLDHEATTRLSIEGLARALGVANVDVVDPVTDPGGFEKLLTARLATPQLSVIVARRPCILAAADIRHYEKANEQKALNVMQAAQAAMSTPGCAGACAAEEA